MPGRRGGATVYLGESLPGRGISITKTLRQEGVECVGGTVGRPGQKEQEPSWWEMGPKGVCGASEPTERPLLSSLSKGEAVEGLGQRMPCLDVQGCRMEERLEVEVGPWPGSCCSPTGKGGPPGGHGWGGSQGRDSGLILQGEPGD